MRKSCTLAFASLLVIAVCFAATTDWQKYSVKPKAGFVPDGKTAISIAVAVWTPIYGAKMIEGEKPYSAVLEGDVWRVEGSLPEPPKGIVVFGGVATAIISKKDGQVLAVWHTK